MARDLETHYAEFYRSRDPEHVYPVEFVVRAFLGRYPRLPAAGRSYAGQRVLDLGCGDGRNMPLLADLGLEVHGVEIAEEICARTVARLARLGVTVDARVGRNHALPFEDRFFDHVLACHSCYYVDEGTRFDDNVREIARVTNPERLQGSLHDALRGRDLFIGLSGPNVLTPDMIREMAPRPIIFALANPVPEIAPEAALQAGAAVVATGRSDYRNQINNAIAFPGIFRGALDVAARNINDQMKIAAAHALADLVPDYELSPDYIMPRALDFRGAPEVAAAVARAAIETGEARRRVDPQRILENTRDYLYGGTLRALSGDPIGDQPALPLKK